MVVSPSTQQWPLGILSIFDEFGIEIQSPSKPIMRLISVSLGWVGDLEGKELKIYKTNG